MVWRILYKFGEVEFILYTLSLDNTCILCFIPSSVHVIELSQHLTKIEEQDNFLLLLLVEKLCPGIFLLQTIQ